MKEEPFVEKYIIEADGTMRVEVPGPSVPVPCSAVPWVWQGEKCAGEILYAAMMDSWPVPPRWATLSDHDKNRLQRIAERVIANSANAYREQLMLRVREGATIIFEGGIRYVPEQNAELCREAPRVEQQ